MVDPDPTWRVLCHIHTIRKTTIGRPGRLRSGQWRCLSHAQDG